MAIKNLGQRSHGIPFDDMEVGDSVVIPVFTSEDSQYYRVNAFRNGKRLGRYFSTSLCPDAGLRITRRPLKAPVKHQIVRGN